MATRSRSTLSSPGIHGPGSPSGLSRSSSLGVRILSPGIRSPSPGISIPSPGIYTNRNSYASPKPELNYNPGFTAFSPISPGTPRSLPPRELPRSQSSDVSSSSLSRGPRTSSQWIAAARENTLEIKKHGSPYPLVWVLVEGKDIPVNAIVGGEDRRKPLYIARAFYEGGVYIGKAGHHLKLGAAIPYNGSEIDVSTYEVLVAAFDVLRYNISDSFTGEIPRMAKDQDALIDFKTPTIAEPAPNEFRATILFEDSKSVQLLNEFKATIVIDSKSVQRYNEFKTSVYVEDSRSALGYNEFKAAITVEGAKPVQLLNEFKATIIVDSKSVLRFNEYKVTILLDLSRPERLSEVKTVILVDDSHSMRGQRWAQAQDALAGVVDLAGKFGAEGVDIYFLNDERYGIGLTEGRVMRELFDSIIPEGQTPTGHKLQTILDMYLPAFEEQPISHKPVTLVVVTDGVPTDDPTGVIVDAARRLDRANVPSRQLGIQFVQIGDDEDAAEYLRRLDDDISRDHLIRDMVDTTPFNANDPYFNTDTLVKILLGAINPILDNLPNKPQFPSPVSGYH